MRKDGILERYFEVAQSIRTQSGRAEGACDVLGLYRLLEMSYLLYQSSHVTFPADTKKEVLFPFAWLLENGDIVRDITANKSYKVSNVKKLVDEGGFSDGEFPDIASWKLLIHKGKWSDSLSSGWIGYSVILQDDDGNPVSPPTENVLVFKTSRYMRLGRFDPALSDNLFIINPENDNEVTEVPSTKLPTILFRKIREEGSSMPGGWFGASNKMTKPKQLGTDKLSHPTLVFNTTGLILDLLLEFKIYAQTAFDLDKLELYFKQFIHRIFPVYKLNGVMDYAFWQAKSAEQGNEKVKQHTTTVEFAFKIQSLALEIEPKVMEVVINQAAAGSNGESILGPNRDIT